MLKRIRHNIFIVNSMHEVLISHYLKDELKICFGGKNFNKIKELFHDELSIQLEEENLTEFYTIHEKIGKSDLYISNFIMRIKHGSDTEKVLKNNHNFEFVYYADIFDHIQSYKITNELKEAIFYLIYELDNENYSTISRRVYTGSRPLKYRW